MAALSDALMPGIVELPQLKAGDLDPLLAEEIESWERRFAWDFRPSADLLRRFLQIRSLSGCALRFGNEVIGYAYYVCEGRKGLIGDFYLRSEYSNPSREMLLLGAVVRTLMQTPGIRRIESQLMLLHTPTAAAPVPFSKNLTRHDRYFMKIDAAAIRTLTPQSTAARVSFVPWAERYLEEMAHVVSASYRGHIDSEINDQYRNIPGSRQFLTNVIRFPGCGRFSPENSVLAIDTNSGRVCGMCLSSHVASRSGHVTQLCILPALRGTALGYELLRQTLGKLVNSGCGSVSLTVTCDNIGAIRLYKSIGFHWGGNFPALVWEGF